jgi:hypothetical protein
MTRKAAAVLAAVTARPSRNITLRIAALAPRYWLMAGARSIVPDQSLGGGWVSEREFQMLADERGACSLASVLATALATLTAFGHS